MPCQFCHHAESRHVKDAAMVACRITGCPCQGYVDPVDPALAAGGEEVVIRVPPGYVLNFQLVPIQAGEVTDVDA